jgi:hypothetical protein
MFNDLISGAIAGSLSRTLTAPLELYKMQLQNSFIPHSTIKAVVEKEGIRYLWKGNGINCIRLAPQYSINFAVFNYAKNNIYKDVENENYKNLYSGIIAGSSAVFCIYPFETIRTRFSLQTNYSHYQNLFDCIKKMKFREYYQGCGSSLFGYGIYSGLSYVFYFKYKTLFSDYEKNSQKLLCGGLTGVTSVSITYPTDLVRRRMQLQGFDVSVPVYNSVNDCIKKIWKNEGIKGFYRGLVATYIKIFPTIAIQFWALETCQDLLK